jgi:hypothetical protein
MEGEIFTTAARRHGGRGLILGPVHEGNGIVAEKGGAEWEGVADLPLPFTA